MSLMAPTEYKMTLSYWVRRPAALLRQPDNSQLSRWGPAARNLRKWPRML